MQPQEDYIDQIDKNTKEEKEEKEYIEEIKILDVIKVVNEKIKNVDKFYKLNTTDNTSDNKAIINPTNYDINDETFYYSDFCLWANKRTFKNNKGHMEVAEQLSRVARLILGGKNSLIIKNNKANPIDVSTTETFKKDRGLCYTIVDKTGECEYFHILSTAIAGNVYSKLGTGTCYRWYW